MAQNAEHRLELSRGTLSSLREFIIQSIQEATQKVPSVYNPLL